MSAQTQILKMLTFRKVWNGFLLYKSFWISRIFKRPIIWGKPLALSIEPTTACNLGCPECPSGLKQFTRPTGKMKADLNKKIIDELGPNLAYINFYFQGEPFINKNIFDLIAYANEKGIYTATSTNAHFLSPDACKKVLRSGLKRLIVSIDGTTQETYEQYRREGSLEKVLEGTRNMIAAKKENRSQFPHIIFQYLVVKPNEHQIEDAKKLAAEMGVDEIRFKTAQVYEYENGNLLIPTNEKYSRYKKMPNGTFRLKNKMSNHCWRMWSSAVITWDGSIVPCCFDKDAKHKLGNMQFVDFNDIWKNKDYHHFRKALLTNREEIDICKNCSEGSKVWA
ncbi:MAG: SPASM domain-containing protein [Flavobacteriales bacterium]|nr:SPASM domain-containing protein [Flavobacteriales bacterium]MCB9196736.1 SPASM domain-containing protein [Flavobacteriales bacterium]MCB9197731.1 SPASM domain-containing protein [Flavobacteriales bacterium]